MIVERNQYLSANGTMTRASNLFHEDLIVVKGQYKKIKSFEDPPLAVMVKTKYKDLYFSPKDTIVSKDLLLPNIQNSFVNLLYQMDEIVLPYTPYSYDYGFLDIREHLLFGSFLYSTSFYDLMLKYDLPKDFLYKALQNGCPDQEYPKGQEYNEKLQVIMVNLGCKSIQELRQEIVKEYSFKVNRSDQKILVKDGLLDLIYLFLIESVTEKKYQYKNNREKLFNDNINIAHKVASNYYRTKYWDYDEETGEFILINSNETDHTDENDDDEEVFGF